MPDNDFDEFTILPDPDFLVCDACNRRITEKRDAADIALAELYWLNWGIVDKACYDAQFRAFIESGKGGPLRLLKVFHKGQDVSEVRRHATLQMNIVCAKCGTLSMIDTVIDRKDKLPETFTCKVCGHVIKKPFGDEQDETK